MPRMSNPIALALADAEAARAKARTEAVARAERVAARMKEACGAVHAYPSKGDAHAGGKYTMDGALADADGKRFELYLCTSLPSGDERSFVLRLLFETWHRGGAVLVRFGGVEIHANNVMNWDEIVVRDALKAAGDAIRSAPPGPVESPDDAREIVFGYVTEPSGTLYRGRSDRR